MKVKKAEITAFLSLIVVLLISFIFGIIEITVIQTEKNLSRICADGAIFSVFGEYESQLMEAYHIFGLDGSYGTGEFNEDKIIGRMHYYSNKNIDYKINGIQYLTDNKGQAFREQVLTYMEQKYGIGLIEDLAGRTSVWEEESIQVHLGFLLSGIIWVILSVICERTVSTGEIIAGILAGAFFLLLSKLTKESFGYGDSILIVIMGAFLGFWSLMSVLFMAFFMAGLFSVIMLLKTKFHKKSKFPFIPFLMAAYAGGIILNGY